MTVLRSKRAAEIGVAAVLALLVLAASASAQVVVRVNDDVNFRFGTLLQGWSDWTQDPVSQGYSQNMFIRRIRFILLASVARNVSVFFQTDNPRLGNAGTNGSKTFNSGFQTVDGFLEWKLSGDSLMLDAGIFAVPSSRDGLTRAPSFLPVDIGAFTTLGNSLELGSGTRDTGMGIHGYLGDGRLEYRLAALEGRRQSSDSIPPGAAGSRNPYRVAGRLNYDFFDLEYADTVPSKFFYPGTNLGAKKVVAIGAWGDGQGPYKAYGADFMFDWPVARDAVTATGDYEHFEQDITNPTLPKQNDVLVAGGYYIGVVKLQPFLVYQKQNFSDEIRKSGNLQRYGGGLNWYVSGINQKLSVLYERLVPATKAAIATIKNTNHIVIQMQVLYF